MKISSILFLAFFLFISSCKSYKQKIEASLFTKSYGTVEGINYSKGYFIVYWECEQPQFKNQPCWAESKHLLRLFHEVQLGDTLFLTQNFR